MLRDALQTVNTRLGKRVVIWAGVAAVLAMVLDFVPLFDLLGYDFSFALGLLVAVAAVDVGAGVVQAARRRGQAPDVPRAFATAAVAAMALLVLPLLLSLANALRVRNCNVGGGLAFFAVLPVASALYGAGAGVVAATLYPTFHLRVHPCQLERMCCRSSPSAGSTPMPKSVPRRCQTMISISFGSRNSSISRSPVVST